MNRWKPFCRDYEGFPMYGSDRRGPLRPRKKVERVYSRQAWRQRNPRARTYLVVVDYLCGHPMQLGERRVTHKVGMRVVEFLRRRGHLAFIY